MKRRATLFTALILAVCLILGMGVTAAAEGGNVSTVTAPVGSYLHVLVDLPGGETLREYELMDGAVAPGLDLQPEGEGFGLAGTPLEEGNWVVHLAIKTDFGSGEMYIEQVIQAADTTPPPSPTAVPEVTYTPAPTSEPTPEPTLAPTPEGLPTITKHPSGETLTEGGTAMFVSKADGADRIEWYLADNMGGAPVEVQRAVSAIGGLQVYGQGTNTLTLSGIPASLNGWQVECRFVGSTGAVSVSNRAAITVRTGGLPAPVITLQPEGAELYAGETTTLAARAAVPADGTLQYQWYSTEEYDLAKVRAIDGATESTYVPPIEEGTMYYCVGIKNVRGAEESSVVFSQLVEVTCYDSVRVHTHDFTGPWHWDELHHWHECSCGQRQDDGYHAFQWTVTKKATSKADGERTGVCSVCGYEVTETIPAGTGNSSNSGLIRVLLVILVVLVALILIGGLIFLILRSRGGGSRPPRSGTYNGTRTDGEHPRR